jgi:hypothetical protein
MTPAPRVWNDLQNGSSLVTVLIAAGIGAIVIGSLVTGVTGVSRSAEKANTTMNFATVKLNILNSLSCPNTIVGPVFCVDGTYVDIKNKSGEVFVKADGSTVMGNFNLRALCKNNAAQKGLDVRAAWISPTGKLPANIANSRLFTASDPTWFKKDEVASGLPYNWSHPKGQLFSGSPGSDALLCTGSFSSADLTCPAGNLMKGIAANGSLICEPIPPPCAWNQVRVGNVCTTLRVLIHGGYEQLTCEATVVDLGTRNAWGVAVTGSCAPGFAIEVGNSQDVISSSEPQYASCPTGEAAITNYLCIHAY